MKNWILGAALILTSGCGAAQLVLEKPIARQCAARGMQHCDELTDGVMAYVNGDKAEAETKLRAAAAGNAPARMRQFARALEPIARSAGGDTGRTLHEVIALLGAERETNAPAPSVAKAADAATTKANRPGADVSHGTPVQNDENDQMRTFTVAPGIDEHARDCGPSAIASGVAVCRRTRVGVGPMIVTNLHASGGCSDELFVAAGRIDHPQWFVIAPPTAPLTVAGKLSLDDGEELFVGVRSAREPKADLRCSVTWSGYKPTRGGS